MASARRITGLPQGVTERQFDESLGMFSTDGHISDAQLKLVARAVVETGMIDRAPDLAAFYSSQFLPN